MTNDEIISAFIDGEAVDPELLANALADPAGRKCLVDLLRLGALVAEAEDGVDSLAHVTKRTPQRWRLAAAAALIAGVGAFAAGMQVGQKDMPASTTAQQQAPAPDRVIEIEWRDNVGGM